MAMGDGNEISDSIGDVQLVGELRGGEHEKGGRQKIIFGQADGGGWSFPPLSQLLSHLTLSQIGDLSMQGIT